MTMSLKTTASHVHQRRRQPRQLQGRIYIITIDLNNDEKARDSFYRSRLVSEDPNGSGPMPKPGLNGLIPKQMGGNVFYELNSPVQIWSAGPDGMIDFNSPADQGVNRDNILS